MLTAICDKLLALKNHQGFRRYAANTSWLMAENLLRVLAGLFVGVWVARYLGPDQYGLFSYVLAFTAIFAGIAKLGLDEIMVRELVNQPEKPSIYLGTAFWLKIIGAFIVIVLMALIMPFTSNDTTTNIFIFIIASGFIFQSFEVVEFYFQSQVLAKVISTCKVTQLALSSILKICLVLAQADLFWFVCVSAFDLFSLAASYYIAYKIKGQASFFFQFNSVIAKNLVKDSWPVMFTSLVIMMYMRIDQVMIKEILSDYEVGLYSAAVKLSEAWYFVPTFIAASLFPAILNAKKESESLYYSRLQRLYTFLVVIALLIAIPVTLFSDIIVLLLYGPDYEGAGSILMVHIWAGVIVGLGVARGKWVLAENLQFYAFLYLSAALLINVVANYYWIPSFGNIGAAYATLLAQITGTLIFPVFVRKTRKSFFMMIKALTLYDLVKYFMVKK